MKDHRKIIAKLVLSFLVTTLSPLSFTALSTQSNAEMEKMNAQLFKELTKIKNDLSKGDIQSAKETLAQMKKLYGKFPQYQSVITLAQNKIAEKEGVDTKTRTPLGKILAQKSPALTIEPDEADINAFDNAFLTNNTVEAERIYHKYPRTPEDSAKKTDFLDFAANALKILREGENVGSQKMVSGQRTRTASGFNHAFEGFFAAFKDGLSTKNINLAKESLVKMEKYSRNNESDQSSINFVKEKINEFEKKHQEEIPGPRKSVGTSGFMGNVQRQQDGYGSKTRTPMGIAPKPAQNSDVSDEDIAAFKDAFMNSNLPEAERIFSKYPKTAQDSKKKKEFLDLAQMELESMR